MRRKLWVLMKKDICICPGWVLLGIILTLFMPTYLIQSIEMPNIFYEPILILCAICTSNLVVSRICYIEDNQAVKTLLSSLPITRKEMITARFLIAMGLTILFALLAEGIGILMGIAMSISTLLTGLAIGLAYESLYLFLFYKWGNQVAQYALVVFVGIVAAWTWYFF